MTLQLERADREDLLSRLSGETPEGRASLQRHYQQTATPDTGDLEDDGDEPVNNVVSLLDFERSVNQYLV